MLGQCLLGMNGGPTFPEVLGTARAVIQQSRRGDDVWCDVTTDADYELEIRPTRDPEVPTTLDAQAFLYVSGQEVSMGKCTLTPYEDDANLYEAAYDCVFPPRGEDLPQLHVIGAFYVHPIPDTLK
jgi:hypothetical protein